MPNRKIAAVPPRFSTSHYLRLCAKRQNTQACDSKNTWKTVRASRLSVLIMIGEELRKGRLAAGLSQEELAFRAGVTRNYISLVELNHHSPTLDTLFRICHALGIPAWPCVRKVESERKKLGQAEKQVRRSKK